MTDCSSQRFEFQGPTRRPIVASFDGGEIVTEGGAVLLQEVERQTRLARRFAACLEDAFLDSYTKPPKRIILDLDATYDPVHGSQEGRFFQGYSFRLPQVRGEGYRRFPAHRVGL